MRQLKPHTYDRLFATFLFIAGLGGYLIATFGNSTPWTLYLRGIAAMIIGMAAISSTWLIVRHLNRSEQTLLWLAALFLVLPLVVCGTIFLVNGFLEK